LLNQIKETFDKTTNKDLSKLKRKMDIEELPRKYFVISLGIALYPQIIEYGNGAFARGDIRAITSYLSFINEFRYCLEKYEPTQDHPIVSMVEIKNARRETE
jgi:hypothetical protein